MRPTGRCGPAKRLHAAGTTPSSGMPGCVGGARQPLGGIHRLDAARAQPLALQLPCVAGFVSHPTVKELLVSCNIRGCEAGKSVLPPAAQPPLCCRRCVRPAELVAGILAGVVCLAQPCDSEISSVHALPQRCSCPHALCTLVCPPFCIPRWTQPSERPGTPAARPDTCKRSGGGAACGGGPCTPSDTCGQLSAPLVSSHATPGSCGAAGSHSEHGPSSKW